MKLPYKFVDPDGRQTVLAAVAIPVLIVAAVCEPCRKAMGQGLVAIAQSVGKASETAAEPTPTATGGGDKGSKTAPPLPIGLVGTQDEDSRQKGNRVNNGPLAPANGGTGNSQEDFGKLTGGTGTPAPEGSRLPVGSEVGGNGVIIRPGTEKKGAANRSTCEWQ